MELWSVEWRFRAELEAKRRGGLRWHWDGRDAAAHRLETANKLHGWRLSRATRLEDGRIIVAGEFSLTQRPHGPKPAVSDAARAVESWLRWALRTVYGWDDADLAREMLPPLKLSLREGKRTVQ